jgi:aminopeptidase N
MTYYNYCLKIPGRKVKVNKRSSENNIDSHISQINFIFKNMITGYRSVVGLLSLTVLFTACATYSNWGHVPGRAGTYPDFTKKKYDLVRPDPERLCYDVGYYYIEVEVEPVKEWLSGSTAIYFSIVSNTTALRFNLHKKLDIGEVRLDGLATDHFRNGNAVYVRTSETLTAGTVHTLEVKYSGRPPEAKKPPWIGGVVWEKDRENQPWLGVACQSEGASVWFPCKDLLTDEPDSVRLKITVPEGLEAVSNGILEERVQKDKKESFTWATKYPINTYNITFYAGRFRKFENEASTKYGKIPCSYYVLPWNYGLARVHFGQVSEVLNIFSDLFGPYPWPAEGYKLIEAPYEGMEHQTAIAYGSGYSDFSLLGGDYIIVHESAHEWWGNAVTAADFSDIWLQEGFATYSEVLFAERKLGYEKSLNYVAKWLGPYVKNKRPVVGPENVGWWDHNDNDVYHKGALILHTIRNIVGDSTLFMDILQTFYREYALGKKVTTSDFIEVVERKTGSEWDKFFEAYLNSREIPRLKWYFGIYRPEGQEAVVNSNPVLYVCAKWVNVPDGFVMPVTLTCEDGSESVRINVTTKAEVFFLDGKLSCNSVRCNARYSYFLPVYDEEVISELEN